MYILALETTGPWGSAALIDETGAVRETVTRAERNHLSALMPMVDTLLTEAGLRASDLTAVAASVGPGSFTGIRIGVVSARCLAQALDIPAIAVPTLEMFKLYCAADCLTAPICNARRGQVYGGLFGPDRADLLPAGPYMLTDVFAAVRQSPAGSRIVFYGDGVDAYEAELSAFAAEETAAGSAGRQIRIADAAVRYPRAAQAARWALARYEAGETVSAEALLPDYMRSTEAEQKLADGTLARMRAEKMARFRAR